LSISTEFQICEDSRVRVSFLNILGEGRVSREVSIKYYLYLQSCEDSSVSSTSKSSISGGILSDCRAGGEVWTSGLFARVGGVGLLKPWALRLWRYILVATEKIFSHSVHGTGISMFLDCNDRNKI
jgi:hypothetical protein